MNSKIALFVALFLNFLYFPIWWYSVGLFKFAKKVFLFWQQRALSLAILVWIKNLFVPMYGQADFVGRMISFFIRLIQIIFRSVILLFWLVISLIALAFWLLIPIVIAYLTLIQLGA